MSEQFKGLVMYMSKLCLIGALPGSFKCEYNPFIHTHNRYSMEYCDATKTIDLMHWRHISITTTPCWGSRLVALRARAVLKERWLSVSARARAGPAVWHAGVGPLGCMLGDGACDSASFDPQHAGGVLLWPWRHMHKVYYRSKRLSDLCTHQSIVIIYAFDMIWNHIFWKILCQFYFKKLMWSVIITYKEREKCHTVGWTGEVKTSQGT